MRTAYPTLRSGDSHCQFQKPLLTETTSVLAWVQETSTKELLSWDVRAHPRLV